MSPREPRYTPMSIQDTQLLSTQDTVMNPAHHRNGEYVKGEAHTNGVESFWASLKRGYYGVYHKMSVKHLQRYINEFSQRVTVRPMHTIDQINLIISGLVGKRLTYRDLIA